MARKERFTVYMLEFTGHILVNGIPMKPFYAMQIYYLNSRTKRVYKEWMLGEQSYLMSDKHRSIAETERAYHESAGRMSKFFPKGVKTLVTKLGEL